MKRLLMTSAIAAVSLFSAAAFAAAVVGQPAPAFTATDTGGKQHRLADYQGKYVVLEWVNPGCPFVRKHYNGNMQATQEEAIAKGAIWFAINSTAESQGDYLAPAKMGEWMQGKNASATATLMDADGKIGKAYSAKTTPHMYIIDPKGKLVYAGAIDSVPSARLEDIDKATNYVKQAFTELQAGKPVSKKTTTAYGCAVKYAD